MSSAAWHKVDDTKNILEHECWVLELLCAGWNARYDGQHDVQISLTFESNAVDLEERLRKAWLATIYRFPVWAAEIVHRSSEDKPNYFIWQYSSQDAKDAAQARFHVHQSYKEDIEKDVLALHRIVSSKRTEAVQLVNHLDSLNNFDFLYHFILQHFINGVGSRHALLLSAGHA